jgi:outer membrane protein assembly factor BamB
VDAGLLFLTSAAHHLHDDTYLLAMGQDGSGVRWSVAIPDLEARNPHLVAVGGVVVLATQKEFLVPGPTLAYDAETGEPLWRRDPAPSWDARGEHLFARGGMLVAHDQRGVTGLDPRTGETRWRREAAELGEGSL